MINPTRFALRDRRILIELYGYEFVTQGTIAPIEFLAPHPKTGKKFSTRPPRLKFFLEF